MSATQSFLLGSSARSGSPSAIVNRAFLTAEWRYLIMLNFAIDPAVFAPFLPSGTELDFLNGTTFASIVGFRFLRTKVLGIPIPFHRDFDEVNLRFYVRRKSTEGWRRGVVFIRELIPRFAIAFIARHLYGEPYTAVPMRHEIAHAPDSLLVEYGWKRRGAWESLSACATGDPMPMAPGSVEEFIAEHYWGYTAHASGCSEYEVVHPPWNVWTASEWKFDAEVAELYGERFVECLSARPASAFIAEGSAVTVRANTIL